MLNTEVDIIFGIVYIPTGTKCLSSQDANSHLGKQFLAFSKKKKKIQIKSNHVKLYCSINHILGGIKYTQTDTNCDFIMGMNQTN